MDPYEIETQPSLAERSMPVTSMIPISLGENGQFGTIAAIVHSPTAQLQ